jgi:tetratricopeptide (TPR) repeat protein
LTNSRAAIDRALARLQADDLAGADGALLEALAGAPGDPGLLRLHGYVLQLQERHAEAAAAYAQVVAAVPTDWEIWNNLGNARRAAGDRAGAIEALLQASRLRPDLAAIRYNLGVALAELGRIAEAAEALGEAARLGPDHLPTLLALGRSLRDCARNEEALAALDRAAALAPSDADVQLERGRALSGLGRFDEADAAYRAALRRRPGLAAAFVERGLMLERGNRAERLPALVTEAEGAGLSAPDLAPLRALALEQAGRFAEAQAEAERWAAVEDPLRRAQLIGRLADKAGDVASALAAFAEMNRLAAEGQEAMLAAAAAYRVHVAALRDMLTPDYAARWQPVAPDRGRPAPVFLVGFPRSGTTLLDTLLMGHGDVHVLEEEPLLEQAAAELGDFARLPELDPAETNRLRARYFAALDAFEPTARGRLVVDKLPLNLLGAPLIHRLFPEAKLIFAERHPCDVVLSCFMQNFTLNPAMANFLDLANAATFYDLALSVWTRARQSFPLDVHIVRYEAVVEDKAAAMRGLTAFLGLAWDEALLDHQATARRRGPISTPSYGQVAQPIYRRARGRWERYRAQLAGILPVLAPWAEAMGYNL